MEDMTVYVQETQQTPSTINSNRATLRHIIIKRHKDKDSWKQQKKRLVMYKGSLIWLANFSSKNKEALMYRTVLWTRWERERVGRFGRMALKHVEYHVWNESPVQVWCTILDAWGWCTGMTQRDGMGREEGGRFRMGNTCIPVVDSFRYLAKPIQYCKV